MLFQSCIDFSAFKKNSNEKFNKISSLSKKIEQKDKTIDSLKVIINTYKSINKNSSNNLVVHYEYLRKGVVLIIAEGNEVALTTQGSGFLLNKSGIGITNYHVIEGHKELYAKDYTGKIYFIKKIIEKDENLDYAIFQLDSYNNYFNYCTISNTRAKIGENCFAITNPHGLENSLTTGVISSYRDLGFKDDIIQTSVPIAPGSSGGPLFNSSGKVIGITTAYVKGDNLTFAININKIPINKILKNY